MTRFEKLVLQGLYIIIKMMVINNPNTARTTEPWSREVEEEAGISAEYRLR